jgi:aspartyl protease family protein
VSFYADRYGQFWIDGNANGTAFRFLADTGASDVVFDIRDARRLGLDVNRLSFNGRMSTANGIVRTASARIARLTVGPFTAVDVPVSINEGELGEPLLGMAFLRRMNVSMSNGMLTLSGEP